MLHRGWGESANRGEASVNFSIEVICLTDGEGRPVPPWSRPVLVEHASYSSLEEAVRIILVERGWEAVGSPTMVDGHSAVLTVRRDKNVCSIHIMPDPRVPLR